MRFWRRREEALDDEIRDYLERETQRNIDHGMSRQEARQAAQRRFGRPALAVREETRDVWGWIWLERFWQDLKYGTRMLASAPLFTAVAVLSLAGGIGINSAIFSFADAVLLRPLPVSRPGEVVSVLGNDPNGPSQVSYRDYVDLRDRSRSFDGLVAYVDRGFAFSRREGELPQMKTGMLVSGNLFGVLGVTSEIGRDFQPGEDQVPGRDPVLILSHDLWQKQFGSDPGAVGSHLRLNGVEFTVIGVAPASFTGMDQYLRPAFYVPLMMAKRLAPNDRLLEARGQRDLSVKGRLRNGADIAQGQSELDVIARQLEQNYPQTNRRQTFVVGSEIGTRIRLEPVDAALVGMLGALAAVVLMVACANVAGLMLARSRMRVREMALRLAIGAGRARLIRQLLTESFLIAALGGLFGLLVGYGGVRLFNHVPPIPGDYPIVVSFQLDGRFLWFSFTVSALSAILFGLAPALQLSRTDLAAALKTSPGLSVGRRLWARNVLVIAQVAACLVLLISAAQLFRGFRDYLDANPGFRTDHVLMMSFDPGLIGYTPERAQQFYRQLVERTRLVSGVRSAALTDAVPMGGGQGSAKIEPEGYQFQPGKEHAEVYAASVDEGYFETMAVAIVSGRGFRASDTADAPKVAVVNRQFAEHFWPGQDPLGKRFRLGDEGRPWVQIVGVTPTGKYDWIGEAPNEYVYFPLAQRPQRRLTLVAYTSGDASGLTAPLREVVHNIDASQPVYNVRDMADYYQKRALNFPNLIVELVAMMGLLALGMALVGLYGLLSYAVNSRTREIGIRMAIGARGQDVIRMVLGYGLVLAVAGVVIGLVGSLASESMLMAIFAGTKRDVGSYLLVAPALLATILLASFIPARRASRVDPAHTLRHE